MGKQMKYNLFYNYFLDPNLHIKVKRVGKNLFKITTFSPAKIKTTEYCVKDDVMHGKYTIWWPNGKKRFVMFYDNGWLNGNFVYYREDGKRESCGVIVNNQRISCYVYSKSGKKIKVE